MRNFAASGIATVSPLRQEFKLSTRKKEVKTYSVRAYHDGCGGELVGEFMGTKTVGRPDTPWEHRCKKCGELGWLVGGNYPKIVADGDKK